MHAFKHLLSALLLYTLCIIPYTASAADTNADYRGYIWRIDTAAACPPHLRGCKGQR